MLTINQILKAAKLESQLGRHKYPRNQRYDEEVLNNISNSINYLTYIDLEGKQKTLPVNDDDMTFITRESDVPTCYARTCASGEKIVIVYDSNSKEPAKELSIDFPYKLRSKKCYPTKDLQSSSEQNYTLIWELQNKT
jgi:hypothetical protein